MRTIFSMGFRSEIGQGPPSSARAEQLCRQALLAQMDLDDPAYAGDRAARADEKEAAIDALVAEMSNLEAAAASAGFRAEMDFVGCRVDFRPSGSSLSGPRPRLGQFGAIVQAAITAAGEIGAAYYQRRGAEEVAEIQREIAEIQARQKEAEAKRAQEEAARRAALQPGAAPAAAPAVEGPGILPIAAGVGAAAVLAFLLLR